MTRVVTADENLFERWHALGRQITSLSAVVQNDVEYAGYAPLLEWRTKADWACLVLEQLLHDTLAHIRDCVGGTNE